MASMRFRHFLMLLLVTLVEADYQYLHLPATDSSMLRSLREMSNQTEANTLNLPANASSIRENITDTFSCENRTYGYYADVDNDCQVFHVCLPSQTPSGRNVTYRWSFICPNETIFNQEVLTCTRVPDSIDCKDSPMFYHYNMEIGKISNKTEEAKEKKNNRNILKRKSDKRKENIMMDDNKMDNIATETIMNDIVNAEMQEKLQVMEFGNINEEGPILLEAVIESESVEDGEQERNEEEEMDRIIMERNMRNERQMRRGAFRFRGDA